MSPQAKVSCLIIELILKTKKQNPQPTVVVCRVVLLRWLHQIGPTVFTIWRWACSSCWCVSSSLFYCNGKNSDLCKAEVKYFKLGVNCSTISLLNALWLYIARCVGAAVHPFPPHFREAEQFLVWEHSTALSFGGNKGMHFWLMTRPQLCLFWLDFIWLWPSDPLPWRNTCYVHLWVHLWVIVRVCLHFRFAWYLLGWHSWSVRRALSGFDSEWALHVLSLDLPP